MLRAVSPITNDVTRYYGYFTLSADQTTGLAAGSPVRLDTVVTGNIAISAYRMTLPIAGTYDLSAAFRMYGVNSTNGQLNCHWWNVTDNVSLGVSAVGYANTKATNSAQQPFVGAMITASVPTEVELRINGNVNAERIVSTFTFAKIIQIA